LTVVWLKAFRIASVSVIVSLIVSFMLPTSVWAQRSEPWSPQAPIPDYDQSAEKPPFIVADQANTIHAFNSQSVDDSNGNSNRLVMYRQWSVQQGWSRPNDIFALDGMDIELLGLYLDQDYVVHLALHMGGDIYYTFAPLVNAGLAPAWSTPVLVGPLAQNPLEATIGGDSQGNLAILYAGTADGNGLYMVTSADNGETWSTVQTMALTPDPEIVVAGINVLFANSGALLFVWNEFDQEGIGVAGYYANYDWDQAQLMHLQELDEGGLNLGIKFTTIVEYQDALIMTYYNGRTNGHYWRVSRDGGQSWTEPTRLTPDHIGTNGPVSYAVDSNHVLHLFFGERIDDNNHGVWHLTWSGYGWTGLESIVRGPQIIDHRNGTGFDPYAAKGVVINGNLVFVTWSTDGFAGVNGAWYSYKFIDTPPLPTQQLPAVPLLLQNLTPTPAIPPTVVAEPTQATIALTPTVIALPSSATENRVEGLNPDRIIFASLVPSIVVIGITILLVSALRRPKSPH